MVIHFTQVPPEVHGDDIVVLVEKAFDGIASLAARNTADGTATVTTWNEGSEGIREGLQSKGLVVVDVETEGCLDVEWRTPVSSNT